MHPVLPRSFYQRSTLEVALDLIGMHLCHRLPDGTLHSGQIIETEAYLGPEDRASHARFAKQKSTAALAKSRSGLMFGSAGVAYVYFIYGMHYCFNAIAHPTDGVGAVLVRALIPNPPIQNRNCQGPARLCKVLEINMHANGLDLTQSSDQPASCLWVEDRQTRIDQTHITNTPRIGVAYAQKDAALPYRFVWKPPA